MSIWGSLAGIASSLTSLIPGVGPFIAPILSPLVGSVVNGLTDKGGGTTQDQSTALAKQNLLNSQQQGDYAKKAADLGFGQFQTANDTLAGPKGYFQSILNGDRANTTQTLAPQIADIQQRLNTALTTGSTLNARGGGRASTLAGLPSQATTQINNLYDTARPAAATSLTDIGSREGSLAGSLMGGSNGFYSGSNSATGTGLNNNLLTNQQKFDQAKQEGAAFGKIADSIKGTDWGSIFKKAPASLPVGGSRMPASWSLPGVDWGTA